LARFDPEKTATTTTLSSSLNPASFGQSVTLTATVNPPIATGSVTFKDGGSELGTSALSNGSATYVNSALSVGSHGITAVYAGDGTYGGSTSNTLTQTINKNDNTTTGLVSSLNPSNVGDNVSFTATVSPSATGTVNFLDGASSLGTGTLNGSSQAAVSTSALTAGCHSITGVYSGNAAYKGSTSPTLTQIVNGSAGSISVTVNTNPAGLRLTVDGSGYTAPHSFNWMPGSNHSLGVSSPQAGGAGTRYPFANWSDGGTQNHSITVPCSPTTYTANFGTEYQLTLSAGSGGSTIPASGNWYAAGTSPSLYATASNSGYAFDKWSLDSGTGPVLNVASAMTQVTMNGPNTVSAHFNPVSTTLSAKVTSKTGNFGGIRIWNITVTNTGSTTATAAELPGLLISGSGLCQPTLITSVPISLGDINPGTSASTQLSINFAYCRKMLKMDALTLIIANSYASIGVMMMEGVTQ
jgi:hypothetical protein